jgi:hypothetical protein
VTIQQLLTHTGGTGDIFGPEFDAHRTELRTLQDYVNLYGKRTLEFEPGSRWQYSNYGFLLLGVVVERVGGKSYYDYVSDNVYGRKTRACQTGPSDTRDLAVTGLIRIRTRCLIGGLQRAAVFYRWSPVALCQRADES